MKIPVEIERAAGEPYGPPREAANKGRPPVAILPGYFPMEFLAAAGAHPFRIWGGRAATVSADAELQAYICSMAKSVLEDILDGTLDFCAAFVVPAVCDTMQNLSDVIAAHGKRVFCFRVPRATYRAEAEQWLAKEAQRFAVWVEGVTGRAPSAEALGLEADRYAAARGAVLKLYALRRDCPAAFAGTIFYDIVSASFVMDPAAFTAALSGGAVDLKKTDGSCGGGKRVIVSGTAPIPASFLQVFADHGLDVVDDDFMAGRRLFSRPILASLDADHLSATFLDGAPCPSNTFGHGKRPAYLADLAAQAKAAGVVFWQTKACENEAFDLPWIEKALREKGLRTLLVETEQKMRTFETAAQRVAAFAETL